MEATKVFALVVLLVLVCVIVMWCCRRSNHRRSRSPLSESVASLTGSCSLPSPVVKTKNKPRLSSGPRTPKQSCCGPFIGPQGHRGPPGDRGCPGARGEKGEQGPLGQTGPRGPHGVQGYVGETGVQGTVGFAGPQGPRGVQGLVGLPGFQGYMGRKAQGILPYSTQGSALVQYGNGKRLLYSLGWGQLGGARIGVPTSNYLSLFCDFVFVAPVDMIMNSLSVTLVSNTLLPTVPEGGLRFQLYQGPGSDNFLTDSPLFVDFLPSSNTEPITLSVTGLSISVSSQQRVALIMIGLVDIVSPGTDVAFELNVSAGIGYTIA